MNKIYTTSSAGFTLLELMTVITLVGIMSAVALPYYNSYRAKAFDFRAQSDLRNVATAEEAYFLDSERYLSCSNDSCSDLPGIRSLSKGVSLSITATDSGFTGTSTHPKGSNRIFHWDSSRGEVD